MDAQDGRTAAPLPRRRRGPRVRTEPSSALSLQMGPVPECSLESRSGTMVRSARAASLALRFHTLVRGAAFPGRVELRARGEALELRRYRLGCGTTEGVPPPREELGGPDLPSPYRDASARAHASCFSHFHSFLKAMSKVFVVKKIKYEK